MKTDGVNVNEPIETVPYGATVIPENRLKYLVWKCKETLKRTPGNILEVGVYRGGTLIALAEVLKEICPEYKVYGVDTFVGHPYSDGHAVHPEGKYADVEKATLEEYIKSKGLENQIVLYTGKVEEILESLGIKDVSFAHVDCDLYVPVKYCAQNVPKIMREHGVIYFDDYGHEHCPGATKAIEEVFKTHQLHPVYIPQDDTCWSAYVQL
ncbi:MAG: class I SAM-dependent methyltransferase [Candidatus Moraniibacteriota bacterium]